MVRHPLILRTARNRSTGKNDVLDLSEMVKNRENHGKTGEKYRIKSVKK